MDVEESLPEPADLRPEAHSYEQTPVAAPNPGFVEPEADFDDLEEDLADGTPEVGLIEEEEVTDEEEYDFTPLYVESEDHDLQELEEETLDQEVSVGSAIGDMVRDAHIDQRTDSDASGLLVEEEEAEEELEAAEGVEETEAEEGQVAAVAGSRLAGHATISGAEGEGSATMAVAVTMDAGRTPRPATCPSSVSC